MLAKLQLSIFRLTLHNVHKSERERKRQASNKTIRAITYEYVHLAKMAIFDTRSLLNDTAKINLWILSQVLWMCSLIREERSETQQSMGSLENSFGDFVYYSRNL